MNFSYLTDAHQTWKKMLVIGKTIKRAGKIYHIIGMTLDDEKNAFIYILEPYSERKSPKGNRSRTHRASLKEWDTQEFTYLNCSQFRFGDRLFKTVGGQGGPLRFSLEDYRTIELFFSMIGAGWAVPDWLRDIDWEGLQLVTLRFPNIKRLPNYSPDMPLTITHRTDAVRHIVEKTVTLTVGKKRSFSFTDHNGEEAWCHINKISLIDVWKDTERQLSDPKYIKKVTEGRMQEVKEHTYQALEQSCPKGMCYVGIEYECSKDYQLQFYTKEYLKSRPVAHHGSASFFLMRLKPDQETGIHGLPLKGAVIDSPLSPDTVKIPAELFLYYEKPVTWEEQV